MDRKWHSLPAHDALKHFAASASGLSSEEAARRLGAHGLNAIRTARPYSAARRFFAQFHNVLIYILLASAVITAAMQHWTDTGVIVAVILINAVIGFIQEHKAEQAMAAIRHLLSPHATVLRDGMQQSIDAAKLVPGDIVILAAGDKVPADLRLIEAHSLRTQEAILSGESLDVKKSAHAVAEDAPLGARASMAYSGTLVTSGQGKGVGVETGDETEIGRISALLGEVKPPQTPLAVKINRFSRWLGALIVLVAGGIFLFGTYVRELPSDEMFMVMIGIAVAAIPEGLPAVISITLALGVRAMARENAIVRHLPVIEALGSATVICTDKTGTLTKNELSVSDLVTAEHRFDVTGVGYAPQGKILFDDEEIALDEHPAVHDMAHAAMLNNDAVLRLHKGVWELNGDPTEGALMSFALKAGHETEALQQAWPRTDVIPFSAEARYMATLHQGEKGGVIFVKGAPERLLEMCSTQQQSDDTGPLDAKHWQAQVAALAKEGKRVLAVARREAKAEHRELHPQHVEEGLTLLGLFGIMDAPREEAKPAIADCHQAGIEVKMITGDHVLTASAIGGMLGIKNSDRVMTGADIERLSDEALAKAVEEVNIYARMHPEHKLRLVSALQASGEVVAMTGDGVNDAPALKKADIGIAMGAQGTEVAKEASKLVLADDNFASIVRAIEEGRNVFRNIRRTIQFMMVTDGAEGSTLVIAMLMGFTLPVTPLQILWVNMITAVTLSLAFAFLPRDAAVMRYPPLPPDAPIFTRRAVVSFLAHIALIALSVVALFIYKVEAGTNIAEARTIAVNTLVFFQAWYLWAMYLTRRREQQPGMVPYLPLLVATTLVGVFQLLFTYAPWMQAIFGTVALGGTAWLTVVLASSVIFPWLWVEQFLYQRMRGQVHS